MVTDRSLSQQKKLPPKDITGFSWIHPGRFFLNKRISIQTALFFFKTDTPIIAPIAPNRGYIIRFVINEKIVSVGE